MELSNDYSDEDFSDDFGDEGEDVGDDFSEEFSGDFGDDESDDDSSIQVIETLDMALPEIDTIKESLNILSPVTLSDLESNYTSIMPTFEFDNLEDEIVNLNIIRKNPYKQINEKALFQGRTGIPFPDYIKKYLRQESEVERIPDIEKEGQISGLGGLGGLGILPKYFFLPPKDEIVIPPNISLPDIKQLPITNLATHEYELPELYVPKEAKHGKEAILRLPTFSDSDVESGLPSSLMLTTHKLTDISISDMQKILKPNNEQRKILYTLIRININHVSGSASRSSSGQKMYTVSQLKEFLKGLGLSSSGSKSDLVKRIRIEYNRYMS
uniref:SAP domain-containing protein n=1 Tax=Pithovirus LCPAC101 TaxID=2506586 RepID=A0A481Z4E4_9VIRU|nr:MAG: hypothetical protein LCPAC101_01520 [Pithovirus LCPAC101]